MFRSRTSGRRSSIVPTMAQIKIDRDNPPPENKMKSLDFDRVVNAYSILAVKKRLVKHKRNHQHWQESQRARTANASTRFSFSSIRTTAAAVVQPEDLLSPPNKKKYARWILTVLVGICCGLVACLLVFCTERIIGFRVKRLNYQLQFASGTADLDEFEKYADSVPQEWIRNMAMKHGSWYILIEYICYNAILASLSAALCVFGAPNAVGSGIPEVKAWLNGCRVESFADLNVFVTKIIGTICSVSSGLIVGPEGPLVHLGAIIGQGITKTTRLEHAVRRFQTRHPKASHVFGCGVLDGEVYEEMETKDKLLDDYLQASFGDGMNFAENGCSDKLTPLPCDPGKSPLSPTGSFRSPANERTNLLSLRMEELDNLERVQNMLDHSEERTQILQTNVTCCGKKHVNNTWFTDAMFVMSRFRNDADRRDLISIGVATGFAAAFGAPVGGLLYSFEEASSYFTIPLMWRTLAATAIGTVIIALYHGNLSDFSILSLGSNNNDENYTSHVLNSVGAIPFYAVIGAAAGLVGALFNACYVFNNTWRKRFYSRRSELHVRRYRILEVLFVSVVTSLITFCLPIYIPHAWACTDISDEVESPEEGPPLSFSARFNCPAGQFNEIATIMLGSRDEALNDILTDPSKFEPRTLLLSGITFLYLMCLTFGVFIPSGLFMPTLLTGSSLSGWVGLMIQRHLIPSLKPSQLTLVGATAMLAGVQRTTVSLCVIMMEATGQTKVLIPLIIGVVTARYVADNFNEGFYHINMEMKKYPYLEHTIKESFDIADVSQIMSGPVVTLRGVETASHIETILKTTKYEGFPVLDQDTNQYVGFVRRDQLVALLECGIYLEVLDNEGDSTHSVRVHQCLNRFASKKMVKALIIDSDIYNPNRRTIKVDGVETGEWLNDNISRSTNGKSIMISTDETLPAAGSIVARASGTSVDFDDKKRIIVHVADAEKGMHVDIAAAMNRGAYTVPQTCPVSKAYSLFTAMGLRHLAVLGKDGKCVGMVTRSNFSAAYIEHQTGLEMHH